MDSEKSLSKDYPSTLYTVDTIASLSESLNKYEEAMLWYRHALENASSNDCPPTPDATNQELLDSPAGIEFHWQPSPTIEYTILFFYSCDQLQELLEDLRCTDGTTSSFSTDMILGRYLFRKSISGREVDGFEQEEAPSSPTLEKWQFTIIDIVKDFETKKTFHRGFEDTEKNSSMLAIYMLVMELLGLGTILQSKNSNKVSEWENHDHQWAAEEDLFAKTGSNGSGSHPNGPSDNGVYPGEVQKTSSGASLNSGYSGKDKAKGKRPSKDQDPNDPNKKRPRISEAINFGVRWACPFAKAKPDEYLSCWFINRGDFSGIKQHIKRFHRDIVDTEGLRDVKSYEQLFSYCIPNWGDEPRPSHVWNFTSLFNRSDRYRAMQRERRMWEFEELETISQMPDAGMKLSQWIKAQAGLQRDDGGSGGEISVDDQIDVKRSGDVAKYPPDIENILQQEIDCDLPDGEPLRLPKGTGGPEDYNLDISWIFDVANQYTSPYNDKCSTEAMLEFIPQLMPETLVEAEVGENGADSLKALEVPEEYEVLFAVPPSSVAGDSSAIYTSSLGTKPSSYSSYSANTGVFSASINADDIKGGYKVQVFRKRAVQSTVELPGPKTFRCKELSEVASKLTDWLESQFCHPGAKFNWNEWGLVNKMDENDRVDGVTGVIDHLDFDPCGDATMKYFLVAKEVK
ncbi:hypothetical protein ABW20_dc0106670 [Dactylellina cionopaga]|nr:hypothetical protein ABW20_dc0106670 [Dactylellina cionopaga]